MTSSNPISWDQLRCELAFTPDEEIKMAAERSRLLAQVRAYKLAEIRKSQAETWKPS